MTPEVVFDVIQIIFADIVLSGDNALVIGMAAAGLSAKLRKRAIFIGMALAAGLRILFAITATYLLAIKGILIVGSVLLAWVCWRFYNDLKEFNGPSVLNVTEEAAQGTEKTEPPEGVDDTRFSRALVTILMALAIAFMAFFASMIMRIMLKYRWLSWLGLLLLVYLTAMMLHDGLVDLGVISSFFA